VPLLLEKLTPTERAAYVLREAFDYPYDQIAAARAGDLSTLEQLFAADVVSYSDGGGVVRASRIPVHGATTVAKYHRAFTDRFWTNVDVSWVSANGQHAALLRRDGVAFTMVTVTASADGIDQIMWMMNLGKLAAVIPA
jgi:RNA polymerase sigma-70 factor (ECF subfamily)